MNKFHKGSKILVTGYKGMVGSAIFRKLISKEFTNVIGASRSELDFRNFHEVEKLFSDLKPEIVIMGAAKVGGIYANNKYPYEFILDNLKIQNNIIENSFKNKVKRLLFLGSSCIYPKFATQPIKEEELLQGSLEKTNDSYAIAKIAGIKLCEALRDQYGFDAISLMPTNLYGFGDNYSEMNSHVIPALIRKFVKAELEKNNNVICWGSGSPLREFLHVDDLADACLYVLKYWYPSKSDAPEDNNGKKLTYLNVGTNSEISIKKLSDIISKKTNYKGIIKWDKNKPDGTPRKLLNSAKINELGWHAKININDGLECTIEQYKKDLKLNNLRF